MYDPARRPILVVEDSNEDYEVLLRALAKLQIDHPVQRIANGDDCIDLLQDAIAKTERGRESKPALVLLDLNLPGTDGREVLQYIKQNETLKSIPVAVLTTSSNPRDIDACYRDGANSYIIKSMDFNKFMRTVNLLVQYWLDAAELPFGA